MKKKLLLINPSDAYFGLANTRSKYPPLALGIIAAMTPPHWEVKLLDGNFEDIIFEPADLVCITSFTATATSAYKIQACFAAKE